MPSQTFFLCQLSTDHGLRPNEDLNLLIFIYLLFLLVFIILIGEKGKNVKFRSHTLIYLFVYFGGSTQN